jgi:hypothetical protein
MIESIEIRDRDRDDNRSRHIITEYNMLDLHSVNRIYGRFNITCIMNYMKDIVLFVLF